MYAINLIIIIAIALIVGPILLTKKKEQTNTSPVQQPQQPSRPPLTDAEREAIRQTDETDAAARGSTIPYPTPVAPSSTNLKTMKKKNATSPVSMAQSIYHIQKRPH